MVRKMIACGLAVVCSLQLAVPAWAGGRRLPDGTRIPVRTMEQLSSATLKDSDPVTFAVTALVLIAVATFASYVPARRGMRITPTEALRAE